MKFNNNAGHGKQNSKSCGAYSIVKESVENRLFAQEVDRLLKLNDHTVNNCTVDYPNSKQDCLDKIVALCNKNKVDLNISHHLNSGRNDKVGDGSIGGVEVYVYSKNNKSYDIAVRICKELEKLGFKNRGVKVDPNLYFLRKTKDDALLIEYFFVDDKDDCNLYNKLGYKVIAKSVVEAILNKKIIEEKLAESNKHYANCVLYGNDVDRVGAEIISWYKDNCIFKHVKDHIKWEATNLFVVGGDAERAMKSLNNGEKYGTVLGKDRAETIRKCLEFVGK